MRHFPWEEPPKTEWWGASELDILELGHRATNALDTEVAYGPWDVLGWPGLEETPMVSQDLRGL